jgi:hypothetical protein
MYLFFVRAFNDVDHIAPIVWKMNQDNYSVAVYCLNPEYDIKRDYRLLFLRTNGIKVDFLYNNFDQKLGKFHRFLRSIMFRSYQIHKQITCKRRSKLSNIFNALGIIARANGKLTYALLKALYYRKTWGWDIIDETGAQALCFDHIRPRQYVVNSLIRAAREKDIPVLALPHGVFIYTNKLEKSGATDARAYDKYNLFDYIITQNQLRKDRLVDAGVQKEKVYVLGSARYCDEWMAQNKRILHRVMKAEDKSYKKLKVVFMTTRFAFRIDVDRMLKTFDLLSKINDIEVMVKPHTRTGKEGKFYDALPLKNSADSSSVELCEWADVILVIASSIIVEALVQNKPVLYLKYLHANTTQYEEMGACWTIGNESDLEEALLNLRDGKPHIPYSTNHVANFLSEIIYGGSDKRNVLRDYEQFIVNSARENQ